MALVGQSWQPQYGCSWGIMAATIGLQSENPSSHNMAIVWESWQPQYGYS